MSAPVDRSSSYDVDAAISILMRGIDCGADTAAELLQTRARDLGVRLEEVATAVVEIGHSHGWESS